MTDLKLVKDAVGQPLAVLDRVAHVDKQGNINERMIAALRPKTSRTVRGAWIVELVPYHDSRGRSLAAPYNLIKIARQETP